MDVICGTVSAALSAAVPPGVTRTVYLCDDGKDPKKREYIAGLGAAAKCVGCCSVCACACACACVCVCVRLCFVLSGCGFGERGGGWKEGGGGILAAPKAARTDESPTTNPRKPIIN